jgi:hypothetical protein
MYDSLYICISEEVEISIIYTNILLFMFKNNFIFC